MRRENRRPGRFFLSACFLLEFCCTTFSQLQRTSNSACGNVVCPEEFVQYDCEVDSTVVVWEVSGCQDPLQAVHQQGIDVHEMRMCKDGKNISADIRQVNTSSFRSTLNISDVLSNNTNLSVRCSKDDGSSEILIGMDELISTAPAPEILYTNVSAGIVISWDPILEECLSVNYNFTQSGTCGACNLAKDGTSESVICTDNVVGECTLVIQTIVCGEVANETVLSFPITSSPTTSVTDNSLSATTPTVITTSALTMQGIVGIAVAAAVILLAASSHVICGLCFYWYYRTKKREKFNEQLIKREGQVDGSSEVGSGSLNHGIALKDLDASICKHDGSGEHSDSGVNKLPPVNAPVPANCKKDDTGGSTESKTSDHVIESIEASRPSGGEYKQGSPNNIMKSETSPGGNSTSTVSNDLHLPIEESSKNEDNDKEEHVQLSSLTHKKHQLTEAISSNEGTHQPSLTPTNGIKETSQEPPSPTYPYVTGAKMFPSSSVQRSECQPFHINPPGDDHIPAQQDSEGRLMDAAVGKPSDMMEIRSMLQNMSSQLESLQANDKKIVAVDEKIVAVEKSTQEQMQALEKKLNEKIKKRDKQITKLEGEVSTLKSQYAELERKLQDEGEKHKEEIKTLKEKAASQLREKQNEIDRLKSEKEDLKAKLNEKRYSSSQYGTL